ncbi:MAG: FdtA/QdtA family cupin domain-containing protein [Nocardioides sp.]
MRAPDRTVGSYVDDRGTLVPVELDTVGFDVRRVFAVAGPPGGATRGEHALTCRELIVLVSGAARVEVGSSPDQVRETHELTAPGDSLAVGPAGWLRYHLRDERSVVLVLADAPYRPAPGPGLGLGLGPRGGDGDGR